MIFCFHKYGKIQKDGYQYCLKCGKAIHEHKWKLINIWRLVDMFGDPAGALRLYECQICGRARKVKV